MKKILSFLFICLLAFVIIGCNKPDDGDKTPDDEVKYSLVVADADKKVALETGDTKKITATFEGGTLEWSSSDESVVVVREGTLTAVGAGTAKVTVKLKEKDSLKVEIEVTVTAKVQIIEVTGIVLVGKKTEAEEGDDFKVATVVSPSNATDKTVTWASSDPTVATVDNTGKVTALKAGTTEISATAGSVVEKFTLTVTEKALEIVEPGDIYLDHEKDTLKIGETDQLSYGIDPEEASQEVEWSFDKEGIVSVDENGLLTALKGGLVTVTVSPKGYPDIKDFYQLRVYDNIEGIKITAKEKMQVGKTQIVKGEIKKQREDGSAIVTMSTFKWESSNPEVLTIDDNGLVTAIALGTAKIRAVAEDSGKYVEEFEITVSQSKTYVVANKDELATALTTLTDGDTIILGPGLYDINVTIANDDVTILGPNANVDAALGARSAEAEFTKLIELSDGVKNFTLNGIEISGEGTFKCVGKGENINLKYLYIHDTDTTEWKEGRDNAIASTICFNHADNDIYLKEIHVSNCLFENLHEAGLYLARLLNVKVENCTFHNFDQDAIRGDGGYNNGTWEFLNNKFYNDTLKGTNGIYLQSVSGNQVLQEIYILNNEFINIGDSTKESQYMGAFSCRTYQEAGMKFYFKYNKVIGCLNGLHVRNNGEADLTKYTEEINYNVFQGITGFLHRNFTVGSSDSASSNPVEANFDYNLFLDAEGNVLTYDQVKAQIFEVKSCENTFADKAAFEEAVKGAQATLYVDATLAETAADAEVEKLGKKWTFGTNAFASIKDALAKAEDGAVIYVAAGTYADALEIAKAVKLVGPNAGVKGYEERATEAKIDGAIVVKSDNVTIDGFEISKQTTFDKDAVVKGFTYLNNLLDSMEGEGYINGTNCTLVDLTICGTYTPQCAAVRWIRLGVAENVTCNFNKIIGTNLYDAFRADTAMYGNCVFIGNHVETSLQSVFMIMGVGAMILNINDNTFKDIACTAVDTRGMVELYAGHVVEYITHNTFDHAGYDWRCLRPRNAAFGENKLDVQVHFNAFLNGSFVEADGVKTYANNPNGADVIFNMDNNYFQEVAAADLTVANFAGNASSCADCYDSLEALEAAYNG